MSKKSIFFRMNVLIVSLFVPILLFFTWSNNKTIHVIENELLQSSMNKTQLASNQIYTSVGQLSTLALTMTQNPDVLSLSMNRNDKYDVFKTSSDIKDMLSLQSVVSILKNQLTVYSPITGILISNESTLKFPEDIAGVLPQSWEIEDKGNLSSSYRDFVRYWVEPFSASEDKSKASIILEARFSEQSFVSQLNEMKSSSRGDPFLYHPDHQPILNDSSQKDLIPSILSSLQIQGDQGTITFEIDRHKYLASYSKIDNLGWYLVDYSPTEQILSPINQNRNTFYIIIAFLLTTGIMLSLFLYRYVQRPILQLIRGVQRVKQGNYSTKVVHPKNDEFNFLFARFNDMTSQIQMLIEKVLKEQINSRDAALKQLQSQINPHFLYNCLNYINNMARLKRDEAVQAMTRHLSDYYRYSTRYHSETGLIREEIELVRHYLSIQGMRMTRLNFEIRIPDDMMELPFPRLLLQPLVENSIVHGVEPKIGNSQIVIEGQVRPEYNEIQIRDDGIGMEQEQINKLLTRMNQPIVDESGYALWNINQRLKLLYGPYGKVTIQKGDNGGLTVKLQWPK